MAARRLIIVMIVLLGISTAIAVIVPEPTRNDDAQESTATGETGATGTTGSTGPDDDDPLGTENSGPGILIEAAVKPDPKPEVVRASSGNRLVLTVQTEKPAVVEIKELGLTQTTSEHAPAVFDLIVPSRPEVIEVTTVEDGKPVARIDTRG